MSNRRFKGLYLQATGDPCCFSFVTYTPQTREQMLACGDLDESEEYFNPVIFDFLLFASEAALGAPADAPFPITCLLYTSPSPRDGLLSRMPSSA